MKRRAPALIGLGPAAAYVLMLLPVACAASAPTATMETRMPDEPVAGSFDRSAPPAVPPVVRCGKRYVQRLGSHDAGAGQSGGLLDVIDEKTGAVEATIKVYDNRRDPAVEGDVQDIFFEAMTFDAAGRLIVTDEVGRRFAVDTGTLTVAPLG